MREPDVVIGGADDPYLKRWWIIPRNRFFNIYLHHFLRSDDDRALHDHPWWNISILLKGAYDEVVPATHVNEEHYELFCREQRTLVIRRKRGAVLFRSSLQAHRIALHRDSGGKEIPVWTVFITGPQVRTWGFWCRHGWRRWQDYVLKDGKVSTTGPGCD